MSIENIKSAQDIKVDDIGAREIVDATSTISLEEMDELGWPTVFFADKGSYFELTGSNYPGRAVSFWGQALDFENHLNPANINRYDSQKHKLFVLHSFHNERPEQEETIFKAVTIFNKKEFCKNPFWVLNYETYGRPAERGSSKYPTVDIRSDMPRKIFEMSGKLDMNNLPTRGNRRDFVMRRYYS